MREKLLLEILEEVTDPEGPAEAILESHEVPDQAEAHRMAKTRLRLHAGRKVRARIHRCWHGEHGDNKPCTVEHLDLVER